jgi:hypothetical protein
MGWLVRRAGPAVAGRCTASGRPGGRPDRRRRPGLYRPRGEDAGPARGSVAWGHAPSLSVAGYPGLGQAGDRPLPRRRAGCFTISGSPFVSSARGSAVKGADQRGEAGEAGPVPQVTGPGGMPDRRSAVISARPGLCRVRVIRPGAASSIQEPSSVYSRAASSLASASGWSAAPGSGGAGRGRLGSWLGPIGAAGTARRGQSAPHSRQLWLAAR